MKHRFTKVGSAGALGGLYCFRCGVFSHAIENSECDARQFPGQPECYLQEAEDWVAEPHNEERNYFAAKAYLAGREEGYDDGYLKGSAIGDRTATRVRQESETHLAMLRKDLDRARANLRRRVDVNGAVIEALAEVWGRLPACDCRDEEGTRISADGRACLRCLVGVSQKALGPLPPGPSEEAKHAQR